MILDEKDNVATAIQSMNEGERVTIEDRSFELLDEVSLGHKFAIHGIKKGGKVIKYGKTIGIATIDIKEGEHVHVHNVKSRYHGRSN